MSELITIRVVVHRFDQAEVSIPVFEVEIREPNSIWCDTFGSLELLNAFLLGVRSRTFSHVPNFRELPGGWNLTNAPWQLWPEKVPGEDESPQLRAYAASIVESLEKIDTDKPRRHCDAYYRALHHRPEDGSDAHKYLSSIPLPPPPVETWFWGRVTEEFDKWTPEKDDDG